MKQIIAKQEYTDKFISLYEGQIRNIENDLADRLIEKGIVAEHTEDGSNEGNNVFLIHMTCRETFGMESTFSDYIISETFEEIKQAIINKKIIFVMCDISSSGPPYPETHLFTDMVYHFYNESIYIAGQKDIINVSSSKLVDLTDMNLSISGPKEGLIISITKKSYTIQPS